MACSRERLVRDYKKIKAWELAHQLALNVYRSTAKFPASERFGITSQLRRAASSVPANIEEGSGRATDKDFLRFLDIALGSLKETEYFLLLSNNLNYLQETEWKSLNERATDTLKCLVGFIKAVRT
jgi:four helix bundle protein